ncbi:hypothetical protein TcasGA2_TC005013 [Tribolium castaneum]|uniref:Uncharacterized protein n=1 Tax=Tribolium castaneum TaxID=7070 RepID=D7GY31_TRICA|nr:hypothetical protein TcasGA2_TC005013 [Tribolium castaneum]
MSDESRKKLTVQGRDTLVPVGEGVVGQALPDGQPTTVQTPSVRSQAEASPKATDFKRGSRQTLYEKISRSHSLGSADKKRKYTDMSPGYERSIEPYKKVESPEAFVLTEALDMVIKLGLDLERRIENNTKREIKDLSARLKRQVEILSRTSVRAWVESHRYIEPEKIQIDVDIQTEVRSGQVRSGQVTIGTQTEDEPSCACQRDIALIRRWEDQNTEEIRQAIDQQVTGPELENLFSRSWPEKAYTTTSTKSGSLFSSSTDSDLVIIGDTKDLTNKSVFRKVASRVPHLLALAKENKIKPGKVVHISCQSEIQVEGDDLEKEHLGQNKRSTFLAL